MKKSYNILLFLAMIILTFAVSCGRENLRPRMVEDIPGFEDIEAEDNCIILKLDPSFAKLQTKAGENERGLDSLNENRVNTIDCFFYKTGKTDSAAVFRAIGRTVEDSEKDTTECYVKVYYNDDIAEVLFGSTTDGSCEAFVIANAAINYDASSTVADLRRSVLEYDFSQQEVQPYFTMCSQETAQVTLYTTTVNVNGTDTEISTAAGRVPLYRCASKVQLYLKLPETFSDGVDPCVYAPCPDSLGGLQVRLYSGSKKTYVNDSYSMVTADYIHFSDRNMYKVPSMALVEGKEEYNYGHRPFYTFPMSWSDLDDNAANFIFSIPWQMVKDAEGNDVVNGPAERRYYKLSANVIGRKFEANGFYRTFVYIQSRGDEELDKAEEIDECYYIITDWVHEGVASASGAESISGEFIRYNFLVVEPDEITLNNETSYTFKFKSSSDLENYKVNIDSICFYKYNTGVGVRYQRAVGDSVSTEAQRTSGNSNYIDKNKYSVKYNYSKGEIYFTHELDEVYEVRDIYLTVTNKDAISQRVKIHQKPAIMLQLQSGGNLFINGYYSHVVDDDGLGVGSQGGYDAGDYYRSACSTDNGRYGYGVLVTNSDNIITTYSQILTSLSSTMPLGNLTEINVSAFNSDYHSYTLNGEEYEYRIGDPRVPSGWTASDLEPYLSSQDYYYRNNRTYYYTMNTTAWGDKASEIMLGTQDRSKNNLIAPAFYIGSGWAAIYSDNSLAWDEAVRKCATYQEAGLPAGRWRLPTEAELMFIFDRQNDESIPQLFNPTGDYWTASGWYYENGTLYEETGNTGHTPRCIYDLWYWGSDRMTEYSYHAGPTFD